jgi:hypothetical protein
MAADTANLGQLEEDGEHGGEERRLARFLIGGGLLRRRRLRRLRAAVACDASFSPTCFAAEPRRDERKKTMKRTTATRSAGSVASSSEAVW